MEQNRKLRNTLTAIWSTNFNKAIFNGKRQSLQEMMVENWIVTC